MNVSELILSENRLYVLAHYSQREAYTCNSHAEELTKFKVSTYKNNIKDIALIVVDLKHQNVKLTENFILWNQKKSSLSFLYIQRINDMIDKSSLHGGE